MIIGIVGSRRRNEKSDFDLVEAALIPFLNYVELVPFFDFGVSLVSGGCPKGADRFAEILAKKHNIPIKIHVAEWDKYGKKAGFKRNTYIARDAEILIACVASDRTGGTEDTISKYLKMGKTRLILI